MRVGPLSGPWVGLSIAALLAAAAASAAGGPAGEIGWPRFRGPGGAGHADAPLPLEWSDTGESRENVVWKTEIPGRGFSSPVVLEDRVWITTALEEERSLRALALDAGTGTILLDVEVFRPDAWQPGHVMNSYASPTPVLASGRAGVHFGPYGTAMLDAATGEILWRNTEIRPEYEVGPGSSPILWEDLMIVPFDGTDLQEVVAFEATTGRIAWRVDRELPERFSPPHRKAFSTPIVIETERRPELISAGAQQVVAYDPRTGRRWWSVRYDGYSVIPVPVTDGELVFVVTGYMQAQLLAIRPGWFGDVTDSHVLWENHWQIPRSSSPLVVGDRIFVVNDVGRASWLDVRTGEDLWRMRLGGSYSASPILAGDRIYAFAENGRTVVVAADDEPALLAENPLDGRILATPAALDGSLFVRTDRHVLRIASPPTAADSP